MKSSQLFPVRKSGAKACMNKKVAVVRVAPASSQKPLSQVYQPPSTNAIKARLSEKRSVALWMNHVSFAVVDLSGEGTERSEEAGFNAKICRF